jgi:hypothetical protein
VSLADSKNESHPSEKRAVGHHTRRERERGKEREREKKERERERKREAKSRPTPHMVDLSFRGK